MFPRTSKAKYFYTQGHTIDGLIYRVKRSNRDNEEVSRTPTNKRLIWEGKSAILGIKAFKKTNPSPYLVQTYKKNVWNDSEMKDHIAKTALKAEKKTKQKKVAVDTI